VIPHQVQVLECLGRFGHNSSKMGKRGRWEVTAAQIEVVKFDSMAFDGGKKGI